MDNYSEKLDKLFIRFAALILLFGLSVVAFKSFAYKTDQILNTCIWYADHAQGAQIAIQAYPGRTPQEHTQKVIFILEKEGMEKWYIQKVLDVFKEVYTTQPKTKSSSMVFVDFHNKCVRKAKKDIEEGKHFPEAEIEYF